MIRNKNIYLIPCFGFLSIILVGWIFLLLPISNNGSVGIFDALFTAVSATCVNGLTTVNLGQDYTFLGQVIIAIITEIGAIGFVTFISFILSFKRRKMSLSETLLLSSALNNTQYGKLKQKLKKVVKYTMVIQLVGSIFLSIDFIPRLGITKGIWYSIFHSITAFCNAGFDLFGSNSLIAFKDNIYINIVLIVLMALGGIGYFVIEDIIRCIKRKSFIHLEFHTKIVLTTTLIIYGLSLVVLKITEPNLTVLELIFTSVTPRTTGFSTIDMSSTSTITKLVISLLMTIGGAPGSTSGGIRITSIAILALTVHATLRNKKDIIVFYKKIDIQTVKQAITNIVISITLIFISIIIFVKAQVLSIDKIIFMCASAYSATGLTVVDVATLNIIAKIILITLMYIGRVGPISILSILILNKKENTDVEYVQGSVML
ncbi:MAG: TrkH family potassium uptake protein [Clostridia bacterium]